MKQAFELAEKIVKVWESDPLFIEYVSRDDIPEPDEVILARALLTFQNKDGKNERSKGPSFDLRAMWQANGMPSDW